MRLSSFVLLMDDTGVWTMLDLIVAAIVIAFCGVCAGYLRGIGSLG